MAGRETREDHSSAHVAIATAPVAIVVVDGDRVVRRVHAVPGNGVTIGRTGEAGVAVGLDDDLVSRQHARVRWSGGLWRVQDLGSRNGTSADGGRVAGEAEVPLAGDGVLRTGRSVILLVRDGRGHEVAPADEPDRIVGPELARATSAVARAASQPTLLVLGESGSGKEAAARTYHEAGPRAGGPFVAVNGATIGASVAERLLFGARRGAYSGATDATGFVQAASGGTLFLDEVAELDLAVQAKLLRVIETREVVPLGATSGTVVDVGIVAATHVDLEARVAAGQFRADLYYRLARPVVVIPPLRARKADIPRLVERVLARAGAALRPHPRLVEAACLRPWPGNVRELVSALEAAAARAIEAGRDVVRAEDLDGGVALGAAPAAPPASPAEPPDVTPNDPESPERARVLAALDAAGGNLSAAARALGLHRTQLYRVMDRLGLRRDPD
ncbi:MAG TPA: sigma 54-interacting transcriptional regulator [Kofleriaceae bacterium]|nr:sigma 54-interacting transcriptional regulator [Kofleriaceae bacterium]